MTSPREWMAFHDDELDPSLLAELEQKLASDEEGAAQLAGLDELDEVLHIACARRIATAPDLTDAIMARVALASPQSATPQPPAQLVALDGGARGAGAATARSPGRGGGVRRATPWVAAALAAAAAWALLVHRTVPRPESGLPVAQQAPTSAAAPAPAPAEGTASSGSADSEEVAVDDANVDPAAAIEAVDFGAHGGTIFMVSEGAAATPVVWLSDDPSPSDSEPL